MRFQDIPQFPFASYRCNIGWDYLESWLEGQNDSTTRLEMNPEYQRGYVWTLAQKEAYLEYRLRGGFSGGDIFWNCPNWMSISSKTGILELVDGKQRIDAVLGFLRDEVTAFGQKRSDFEGILGNRGSFVFHINNLTSRYDVVKWYIDMNTGGSVHTENDLRPAFELLEKLKK